MVNSQHETGWHGFFDVKGTLTSVWSAAAEHFQHCTSHAATTASPLTAATTARLPVRVRAPRTTKGAVCLCVCVFLLMHGTASAYFWENNPPCAQGSPDTRTGLCLEDEDGSTPGAGLAPLGEASNILAASSAPTQPSLEQEIESERLLIEEGVTTEP